MLGNGTCKKLPCNHIFHVTCLRSWFQRQQTCPTCRMDVLRNGTQATQNNNNNNANNNANDANANANNNANNANGQIPPIPPFMFQHFQQLFNRANNNQNDRNAAAGTNASNGPTASGSASTSTQMPQAPPALSIPPIMLPLFQPSMFTIPQMPSEAILQGLSDQELRLLEGSERQNIEARLKCLMEVKTLINAATLRLQQYNNLLIHTQRGVSVSTQTDALPESPRDSGPSTSTAKPITTSSLQNSSTKSDSTAPVATISTEIGSSGDRPNDDQELIRKRRLERFTQSAENGQEASTENSAQSEK